MGLSDIKFSERLGLIAVLVQAGATVGMLIVAIVGITQVAPIITYQTSQIEQRKEEEAKKKHKKKKQHWRLGFQHIVLLQIAL